MAALDPFAQELFEIHLGQLQRQIQRKGLKGLERLYREARGDLYDRLLAAGPRGKEVTPTALRALLAQSDAVLELLGSQVEGLLRDTSKTAAELGARHFRDEYKTLARHFTGTTPILALDEAAVQRGLVDKVHSSLLRRHRLQSRSWTANHVAEMERVLSTATMTGKSLDETIKDVMGAAGIAEQAKWRAERIVRTESAHAHGATKYQAMKETKEELGDENLMKRLIETIDNRTGDDSFILHGQTVPVDRPFEWKHKVAGSWRVTKYQHPPNRPNDRAVVIPWDPTWEAGAGEEALTVAELKSAPPTRWRKKPGVEVPPGHKPGQPYTTAARKAKTTSNQR